MLFTKDGLKKVMQLCAIVTLLAIGVTGCAHNNGKVTRAKGHPRINFEFIGVPLLLQGHGSSVPISSRLSLTAAHVAKQNYARVVAIHPHCDFAIIRTKNKRFTNFDLGLIYPGEKTVTYGRDILGKTMKSEGVYHQDVKFVGSRYFDKCPASITDAPIQGGMSGGAVLNEKGELIGIIAAIADKKSKIENGERLPYKRVSLFVPIMFVHDWMLKKLQKYQKDHPWLEAQTNTAN
ncbi:S1 family peptidase [Parashewanella tropica]|uniref:S1 family peptidase n=1 Tax=Parashewanella tropica TaxID=2547970 RepID=UPI00105A490F|nr:serine protease [Parashewanella tropica]